ncbi:MAG: MFS transporter [Chloroflexi bacterium]|nr:MFS transporter [Chloroflexota bacterium]
MTADDGKHNFWAFGIAIFFFGMAIAGFMNINTIIPAFAARLGAPPILVGSMVAIVHVAWNLPQVFAGNIVSRAERKKPVLLGVIFTIRPLIILFAVLVFVVGGSAPWLILVALIGLLVVFFGGDAFAAMAWLDLLGKAFSTEKRSGFIGTWLMLRSGGIVLVSGLIGIILAQIEFPYNYGALFGLAGISMMISALSTTRIREVPAPEGQQSSITVPWRGFLPHLLRLWRDDKRFSSSTLGRIIFFLSMMSYPFYVTYATIELNMPDATISLFVLAQTLGMMASSFLLGRLGDRLGTHRVIFIGTLLALSGHALMLMVVLLGLGSGTLVTALLVWIYVCTAVGDNVRILGYTVYTLDIAPANQIPIYMGTAGTLGAIGMLGPTLGGWILEVTSYAGLFSFALLVTLLSMWIALRLPSSRSSLIAEPTTTHPLPTVTGK